MIHNHGSEEGEGLSCPELRLPDGSLQGKCMRENMTHGEIHKLQEELITNTMEIRDHRDKIAKLMTRNNEIRDILKKLNKKS